MMGPYQPRRGGATRNQISLQVFKKVKARMGALALASAVLLAGSTFWSMSASALVNCARKPSVCGYPDATNTGVRPGVVLKKVPSEVSSGPGWRWDSRGWVSIYGEGAVFYGFEVRANVDVTANNVTIDNVRILVAGDTFGVSIRHARNTIVRNSEISAPIGRERLLVAVKDIYGDAVGTRVVRNDISNVATGVQIYQGVIRDNFIHDFGYNPGDHTNGIMSNGGTHPLWILHNTVFNQHNQTDAIGLFQDFAIEANRVVKNNLIAGGGYSLYAGQNPGAPPTYNIRVVGNRFSRLFWPRGGYWGHATAYLKTGVNNVWSDNVWDDTNQPVPAP